MLQKLLPPGKDLFRLYINESMQTEVIPFDFLDNIQLLCYYIHNQTIPVYGKGLLMNIIPEKTT